MKVALVHDWLNGMRGGERCLEVLCELYPDAPIYTLFHVKGSVSSRIERHCIKPSPLSHLPFFTKRYRYYLPIFPLAIQACNVRGYDLIISSSHCVAKGVPVPPHASHISYIHTPMRYIWDQYDAYFKHGRCSIPQRIAMALLRRRLQRWDVQSNIHVDRFIANSCHVAERIKRLYRRSASVVYPPVDWQTFQTSQSDEGFYLMVTAFAPYKKIDVAIKAVNALGVPLKIIGHGQDEQRLKQLAGPHVEFLGWQPDHRVREMYSRCRAVLFPGEEDFGIVPLEAMATGKPVIAFGKGGVLETVRPLNPLPGMEGLSAQETQLTSCHHNTKENICKKRAPTHTAPSRPTGVFYYEQSDDQLVAAIRLFERYASDFDPESIRAHVEPFDRSHCKHRMEQTIRSQYEEIHHVSPC